jgi:hypothetical protein
MADHENTISVNLPSCSDTNVIMLHPWQPFPYFDIFDVSNLTTGLILLQSVFSVNYLQMLRLHILKFV